MWLGAGATNRLNPTSAPCVIIAPAVSFTPHSSLSFSSLVCFVILGNAPLFSQLSTLHPLARPHNHRNITVSRLQFPENNRQAKQHAVC